MLYILCVFLYIKVSYKLPIYQTFSHFVPKGTTRTGLKECTK